MRVVRLLITSVCLIGMFVAPAAAADPPVFGVEAGVSFSRVSPDAAGTTATRGAGALAGVYVFFPRAITSTIGLQIEAIYNQKNTEITAAGKTIDQNLDYFAIPILAKLPLFKGIYMLEGASFDFPVRAKLQPSSGSSTDIKDQVTNPDVAMIIGAGIPVQRAGLEFRYEGGFRNVSNVAGAGVQRNRSLTGMFRVHF
jgi:hypothetical protein